MNLYIIHWDNNEPWDEHEVGIQEIYISKEFADIRCAELNKNGVVDEWTNYTYTVKEYQTNDSLHDS